MSLAAIFNVPTNRDDLNTWATSHAAHHRDIIRRIYEIGNIALPEYVLEPIDPNNMVTWAQQHQIMHQQMDALLGIKGYNLLNANFKDVNALTNWIQLNANEHYQADELLSPDQGSGPPPPPTVITSTFLDEARITGGALSTFTFPGLTFGAEAPDRYLVACVAWQTGASAQITGVTIGGVAAGLLVASSFSVANRATAMFIALVPTGLTGSVVVTQNAVSLNCSVALYSLDGMSSGAASQVAAPVAINPGAALNVSPNGAVIAVATAGGPASPTATWTNLVEDCDNNYGLGFLQCRSSASRNFTTLSTGVVCTCTFTVSTGSTACFAVFNP